MGGKPQRWQPSLCLVPLQPGAGPRRSAWGCREDRPSKVEANISGIWKQEHIFSLPPHTGPDLLSFAGRHVWSCDVLMELHCKEQVGPGCSSPRRTFQVPGFKVTNGRQAADTVGSGASSSKHRSLPMSWSGHRPFTFGPKCPGT